VLLKPVSDALHPALPLALLLVLLVTACVPARDYRTTAGQRVPGSENNHNLIGGAFSLSPDSRWLFGTNFDPVADPITLNAAFDHSFLLRLRDGAKIRPELAMAARSLVAQEGILDEAGCWKGTRLYLKTPFTRGLVLEAGNDALVWERVEQVPCERYVPSAQGYRVEVSADGSARIVGQSGRTVARYKPLAIIGTAVQITQLQLSRDERFLGWGVSRPVGSFSGNTEAYFLRLDVDDATPQQLASPVGTMRFAPDSSYLYAHTRSFVDDDHRWLIVRWPMPD
jgi:hypothetical protein